MDGSRFDDFARAFVTSRRGALKTFVRGAASGVAAVLAPEAVGSAAPADEVARAKKNPFHRAGKRCDSGQPCGRLAPCTGGFCTPIACSIAGSTYDSGEPNPDNPCQSCAPTTDSWTAWVNVADGTACENADGDPCLEVAGECIFGECVRDMVPNGTACGPGQSCCSGSCCDPGEGCGDFGCEPVPSGCLILGNPYDDGETNPGNPCEVCDHANPGDWSQKLDNAACGDNLDRFCCRGDCCGTDKCCTAAGTCEDCADCTIANDYYSDGDVNRDNPCEVCDSSRNASDWSPASTDTRCGDNEDQCCNGAGGCDICDPDCVIDGKGYRANEAAPGGCAICDPSRSTDSWTTLDDNQACGEFADRFCCAGVCCDAVECCNEDRVCEVLGSLACAACRIDRVGYLDGDFNSDKCQVCDSSRSTDAWSPVAPGSRCGVNLDRFCCNGECCGDGLCCNDATGRCEEGSCGACVIDGVPYDRGRINPENNCQYCDPPTSTDTWTNLSDRFPCSDNWDKSCCGGECNCGPVCSMPDGKYYFDGEANPEKDCEVCSYARDRVAWSPADDRSLCGEVFGQECCGGVCCADGKCCYEGNCVSCDGCRIDGVFFPDQTNHPTDDCQYCNRLTSTDAWTPRSDAFPCENSEKTCCGGVCQCGPGCEINGAYYFDGVANPDKDCEVCKRSLDRFSWSPADDRFPCGEVFGQECCRGVCCADGECCYDGQCLQCDGCTIDEVFYPDQRINPEPEHDCQICNISLSFTTWSHVDANTACGANGDRFCCNGDCCALGACCDQDGVCASRVPDICDGCVIEDRFYLANTIHPENSCQYCHPETSTDAWTSFKDDDLCGDDFEQRCCDGVCCEALACCNEDRECEEFGSLICADCRIDRAGYLDGDPNPHVDCQICDPSRSDSTWSEADDDSACGANGNQFCCAGTCCEPAYCCTPSGDCERCECSTEASAAGVRASLTSACDVCCNGLCCSPDECCGDDGLCGPCAPGCTIDGVFYLDGKPNPHVPFSCEACNILNPTEWSPRFHPDCPPPCTIGGIIIAYGTINPLNACEHCDGGRSRNAWSPTDPNTRCGPPNQAQFCCQGVCCEAGACCTPSGACDVGGSLVCDGCDIAGSFYADGERNPATVCQICDIDVSTTAWTNDDFWPCNDVPHQTCCHGFCCAEGQICRNGNTDSAVCR